MYGQLPTIRIMLGLRRVGRLATKSPADRKRPPASVRPGDASRPTPCLDAATEVRPGEGRQAVTISRADNHKAALRAARVGPRANQPTRFALSPRWQVASRVDSDDESLSGPSP